MKRIILYIFFQLLSVSILCQQDNFNIPQRFELKIISPCPIKATSCDYNYGLTPRLSKSGNIDKIWTDKDGEFMSFYYVLSHNFIDTLRFTPNQNIRFCEGNFAGVNIGFYGVYSAKYPQNYYFPKHGNLNDTKREIQVPQLIKELLRSGNFIKSEGLENIKLIIVDVLNQTKDTNPNQYFRNQGLKILSRFFYILWDTKRKKNPPKVYENFKNYCHVLPLFNNYENDNLITESKIKEEKYVKNNINDFQSPDSEYQNLKTQIKNYFHTDLDGIEILNDNFRIEFPKIKGEIILHGLKTNRPILQGPYRLKLKGPYRLKLEPNKIKIKLFQQISNRRNKSKEDPEARILLDKANKDIIFSLNSRTNINDINIEYFSSDHFLQYPKIYSNPKQIIIKPKNNDYFEVSENIFDEKTNSIKALIKFKKDTLKLDLTDIEGNQIHDDFEVQVYYHNIPLMSKFIQNGEISDLYCHKDVKYKLKLKNNNFLNQKLISISEADFKTTKTIQVKSELVEFYIELFESKTFNQMLNLPKDVFIINKNKNKLPIEFNLPDSLNQYWMITSNTKDRLLEETEKFIEIKKIPVCRKIIKRNIYISFKGDKPDEKIDYKILAFNPNESKESSLNILNKETEQFKLEFPPNPTKGDSLSILIKKPFGYNIVIGDKNPLNYNWEKPDIVLDFVENDYFDLNFSILNPIQIFYIDVSNSKDKPCFIKIIRDKIDEFKRNKNDFIIYISNNNNPVVINSQNGNVDDIIALTQINPLTPNPNLDIELFSNYITKGRRNIALNFLLSKQQFDFSLDELIGGTLKEIYNLYGIGIGNNTLNILNYINDNKKGNVSVSIYINKSQNNKMNESENFIIKTCNNY